MKYNQREHGNKNNSIEELGALISARMIGHMWEFALQVLDESWLVREY